MGLASRLSRHERQRRVMRKIREQRTLPRRESDPGSLLEYIPRLSPQMRRPDHLAGLAASFERGLHAPGSVRDCWSVAVRFGKTTLVHHAVPWILDHDPTRKILYVSYAHGFAAKQTGRMKELAQRAGILLRGRRRDEWTTKAGGLVKAAGIGGQLTGEGFTDIILDDPHKNRAEVESRVIREGVVEAFFNDVYTRRDPRGTNIWIVHARWHVNDLMGVVTRMESNPFAHNNLPALEGGESLAPWLFDAPQLRELEATLGPYVFSSLYQGRPRPRGGTLFVEPTLTALTTPANYRLAIGLDLARSSSTRADHNAAVVMRKDLDRGYHDILEAVRARGTVTDRMRGDELVDEGFLRLLVRVVRTCPDAALCMYAAEVEMGFVALLERELSAALGYDVTIHAMPIAGDKYMRAQPYAASWNRGLVRIPGRASVADGQREEDRQRDGWQSALVGEHVDFTGVKGDEDDQVDAAVAAHDFLNQEQGTSLEEAMAAVRRVH